MRGGRREGWKGDTEWNQGLPLMDESPTDPSTMMTALVEAMRLTGQISQP